MSGRNILSWRCLRVAGRTTGITNGQIREPCLHMAMQTMNTGKSNLQGCRFLLFRSHGLEPAISGTCEGQFTVLLSDSETVQQRFVPESGLAAPVARGDMVGTLQVSIGDIRLAGYPVYAAETVDKKDFSYYIGTVFDAFFY